MPLQFCARVANREDTDQLALRLLQSAWAAFLHLRRLPDDLSVQFLGSPTIVFGDVDSGYLIYRIDRERLQKPPA